MRDPARIAPRNTSICVRIVLAVLAPFAWQTGTKAETLSDAIAAAYTGNPDLLAQRAQLRAISERYIQARASLGFSVDASASIQAQHALVDSNVARGNNLTAQTMNETLSITQPLYTGGRADAAIQAALANVFVAYQNVRQEQARILQQVVGAYIDVQRDQQIVLIDEDNVALLEGQITQTAAKLAVRESTLTDRDQGYARVAAGRAQVVIARARLANSRSNYLAIVGNMPGTLAEAPPLPDLAPTVDAVIALAEQSNPALLAAKYQERSSRAGVLQARAATMPTLSLRGDVNQGPLVSYEENLRNNSQSVRLILSVPLFSSGAVSSRVREARARNDSDLNSQESARREAQLNVSQAWDQTRASLAAVALYDQQVSAQEGVYKGTKLEEQFALRSTLDILNAAQELNSARLARATAAHDAYAGKTALLVAAGKLEPMVFGVPELPGIAPDLHRLDRDLVPWVGALRAVDGIGQERVIDR